MNSATNKLFITVAICTRNRAETLASAIASVVPQLDEGTELLVVDNASTDATASLLREWAARDPRIRVLNETAPGIAVARNTAVREARGEYIVFFDDDEIAEPGWLVAYREFLAHPPAKKIGAVGGPYLAEQQATPPIWVPRDFGAFDLGPKKCLLTGRIGPAGGNCAYVKQAILEAGGFATELIRHEDSEMNLRLREAGYEIWWLPEAQVRHVVSAERFSFGYHRRLWFSEGRAAAVVRWRAVKGAAGKGRFIAARLLVAPLHALFQLISAGALLLFWQRRASARLFFRACRTLGMMGESWRLVCRRKMI